MHDEEPHNLFSLARGDEKCIQDFCWKARLKETIRKT
jgi:hypothetical protein